MKFDLSKINIKKLKLNKIIDNDDYILKMTGPTVMSIEPKKYTAIEVYQELLSLCNSRPGRVLKMRAGLSEDNMKVYLYLGV